MQAQIDVPGGQTYFNVGSPKKKGKKTGKKNARKTEKKTLAKLGYRVRTKKTRYASPPEIKRVARRR